MNSMLYKKYHRNLVKQFKMGAKFKFKYSPHEDAIKDIVWKEPCRFNDSDIKVLGIHDSTWLTIVFYNGRINNNIKIEDAV